MSDPRVGDDWHRDGAPPWRVVGFVTVEGGAQAVSLTGPGPCRGMTTVLLETMRAEWRRAPQPDPDKVWPIVCSGHATVNGHHVPRLAWEVHAPTSGPGLERMARALLECEAIVTSSYVHGFGAHKMGRGVSASWLVWLPRGAEARFDAVAQPEERRKPSRVSVGLDRGCEVAGPSTTEFLSCLCGDRILRADYVSGEWVVDANGGRWVDDGKAWAHASGAFRDRHSREAHRTELQQRRLALDSKHIPDDLAWLVYTTAEEGHGGALLFWRRGDNGNGAGYTTRLEEAGRWREPEARRLGKGPRDRQADPRYAPGDHAIPYLDAVRVALRVVPIGALPKPEGARW